jgi:diguanylate cyclase (GGDEF)-like protein
MPNPTMQQENESTHDVFLTIRALDAGIANHEAWVSEIHQSLICGTDHANPADLCEDAHCHCKFGKWLYSPENRSLESLEAFQSVVEKHQQMHAVARAILRKSGNRLNILEGEYRDFTAQALSFKHHVREFQYLLMSRVCVVDHLTGVWNRHVMYSKLGQEQERLARSGQHCTICMMDIDHFKQVNDTHGHIAGDQVLKQVIDFCRDGLRKYDSIYRYGGEEFLFCLPHAEQDEAKAIIERLCAGLGGHAITLPGGEGLSVTASFGIASLLKDSAIEDSIQAADHALLCAKAQGRNRVCSWDDVPGAPE